jgi:hypothetical protein
MVKRIKLTDTDADEAPVVNGSASATEAAMLEVLEKMDWKLWELYKTAKRVEKYLEIEDLDVTKKS